MHGARRSIFVSAFAVVARMMMPMTLGCPSIQEMIGISQVVQAL